MPDLSDLQAAQTVKIIGADSTGIETTPVSSSPSGDLSVSDGVMSGGTQGALSLTANTAIELKVGASRLSARKLITAFSPSALIYWGYTSGVTVATGTHLYPGVLQTFALDASDANTTVYLICATATSVRITEAP